MIYLFLAPGFEEVEALFPLDILRRAGLEVATVGIGGRRVPGAHGVVVEADLSEQDYDPAAPAEAVILPAVACGAWLCAICAAPSVLGRRGYLRGLRATCFPGFENALDGAREIGGKVIRDGKVITAAGAGVAMEFGLEVVSVLCSPEQAGRIRAGIQAP